MNTRKIMLLAQALVDPDLRLEDRAEIARRIIKHCTEVIENANGQDNDE